MWMITGITSKAAIGRARGLVKDWRLKDLVPGTKSARDTAVMIMISDTMTVATGQITLAITRLALTISGYATPVRTEALT